MLIIKSEYVTADFLQYLLSKFEFKSAGLAPEDEFKQWVFIGTKIRRITPTIPIVNEFVKTTEIDDEVSLIATVCKPSKENFTITTTKFTGLQVAYTLEDKSSLWDYYFDSQIVSRDTNNLQPLMELMAWFITMGILGVHIAGFLDNGKMKVLLRGKVHKECGQAVYRLLK